MRYYPLFLKLAGETVIFSGAGDHAGAKIALLLKTDARIEVFGTEPSDRVFAWAQAGKIKLHQRPLEDGDAGRARLVYGANDDPAEDARAVEIGRRAGALTNIVDNLDASEFLTPAIVDRDPVTVAIGTEGTAPVLARQIKAQVEEMLPATTGTLARIGDGFRAVAAQLPGGRTRREFWSRFFFREGPEALKHEGENGVKATLARLFDEARTAKDAKGSVTFVGAGPGDPELMALKARKALHDADVVLHDRLVSPQILELARREATVISVGKKGYGPSWKQADIDALLIEHALSGAQVVRLKAGDPAVYGRLDEEIDALDAHSISWTIVPGITAASAAAAAIGTSLTRRGRNSALRMLTAREVEGFAEHDWKSLAAPGATAAIYMGVRAIRFLSGRLLMHGAAAETPVTIVENASRLDQRVIATTLGTAIGDLESADVSGPAIIFLGLAPHQAQSIDLGELSATGTEG